MIATHPLHRWSVTPKQAVALQRRLAARIIRRGRIPRLRVVAGADAAFSADKSTCIAGVVVWDIRDQCVVEQHVVRRPVRFPYVPGLLSFRETPAVLAAIRKLRIRPDVFLFDGQGYAHPRRIGFASHTGLFLDRPSIGCAKSLLVGGFGRLRAHRGATTPLMHGEEVVGAAVRTRDGVRPVFVSVGHRINLEEAVRVVLACGRGYRIPEPTRLADILVAREKKRTRNRTAS